MPKITKYHKNIFEKKYYWNVQSVSYLVPTYIQNLAQSLDIIWHADLHTFCDWTVWKVVQIRFDSKTRKYENWEKHVRKGISVPVKNSKLRGPYTRIILSKSFGVNKFYILVSNLSKPKVKISELMPSSLGKNFIFCEAKYVLLSRVICYQICPVPTYV